jgi:phage repressor protein C with HTH and peptisase S24 domain
MSTSLVVYIMPDDTMTPTILNHTAVIIDTNIKTFTKNGIYLIKNSGLTELRRIQQIDNTAVIIQTDNKAYTSKNDDKLNLNIIGKAIGTHTYFSL